MKACCIEAATLTRGNPFRLEDRHRRVRLASQNRQMVCRNKRVWQWLPATDHDSVITAELSATPTDTPLTRQSSAFSRLCGCQGGDYAVRHDGSRRTADMQESVMIRAFATGFFAVLIGFSAPGLAQETAPQGTFAVTTPDDTGIKTAIDNAVAKMNFLFRAVARGRLHDTNPRYQRLEIHTTDQQISVQFDQRAPIVMPATGAPVKWKREDGEVFDVSAHVGADALTQTFRSDEGQRVNEFRLHPDGSLSLDVTVTSPKLPAPVKYTLQFRREAG